MQVGVSTKPRSGFVQVLAGSSNGEFLQNSIVFMHALSQTGLTSTPISQAGKMFLHINSKILETHVKLGLESSPVAL